MPKCDFCGNSVEKGTGMMFVYVSGKVVNFCSRKCEKNMFKLGRKPLETRWTQAYRQEHKKDNKESVTSKTVSSSTGDKA